jgi:glycosidase
MQNLMDSHDTDRLASMIVNGEGTVYAKPDQIEFNNNNGAKSSKTYQIRKPNERERSIQRMIALFQLTYLGAPMIYYGTEAGMWGGNDPDERMPMVWPEMTFAPQAIDPRGIERTPDEVQFDPQMFDFYKRAIALRRGHEALNHGDYNVLATDDVQRAFVFSRRTAKETLVMAFNRADQPATIELHLSSTNLRPIFVSNGDASGISVSAGKLVVPPLTAVVLSYN